MELKDWLNSINFTKEDLSEDIQRLTLHISLIVVCLGTLIVSCLLMK